jgi:hypothetical protein
VTAFEFHLPEELVTPQSDRPDRWYKGAHFNVLPSKSEMRHGQFASVLQGWKPPEPIIHADTRVVAMGSCFASYFVAWLDARGFNRTATNPLSAFIQGGFAFENVAVIAQQFRWAFEGLDGRELLWVDPDKQLVEATEERRQLVRSALSDADVLIATLGLSEIWYDRVTGEPLWRAVPERVLDPERHIFKVLSVAETVEQLEIIERIRSTYVPKLKIVYTVSPVRLKATFRPVSTLTANSVSKAIIRAALDEFLRAHRDQASQAYYYFPSYEIVSDISRDPYEEDARHIREATVSQVLNLFAQQYTSLTGVGEVRGLDESYLPHSDLLDRIEALETRNAELQTICDERMQVIKDLDQAARERLELINQLSAQCRALAEQVKAVGAAAPSA